MLSQKSNQRDIRGQLTPQDCYKNYCIKIITIRKPLLIAHVDTLLNVIQILRVNRPIDSIIVYTYRMQWLNCNGA